jgi:predicted dehydrogenase
MKTVRWGVIGAGGIARRRTIPEGIQAASNAQLIAVMDRNSRTREELRTQYQVPAVATVQELLDLQLDAVYIATPTFEHAPQALAAAAAGKHILCEKPLALDVKEASQILAACRDAHVKLGVGYMMRFHSAHKRIRDWITDGRIGAPVMARAQLACWHPPALGHWRQVRTLGGGGALADLGLHCFDLLEFLLGPIADVSAITDSITQRYQDSSVEDSGLVSLRFENGMLGVVESQFNVPDAASENVLEITGTHGAIKAVNTIGQDSGGGLRAILAGQDPQASVWEKFSIDREPNIYQRQIEAFSDCILSDTEPPIPGEAGVRGMRLLAACYDSALLGKTISVREPTPARPTLLPQS